MTSSNDPDDYVVRQAIIDGLWDGGDESRVSALMAENERERRNGAEWERQWNDAAEEIKGLREALIAMDEAICHGSPETAKRIAREAIGGAR